MTSALSLRDSATDMRQIIVRVSLAPFLLGLVLGATLLQPHRSTAYSFDWPANPYESDYDGNYAYRDMWFEWWGCSGGWCWFGNMGTWANITSPSAGYHYDSWGAVIEGSQNFYATWFNGGALSPSWTYYNTPRTQYPGSLPVDMYGETVVQSGLCGNQYCAATGTFWTYASFLGSVVPAGSSYGYCDERWYPWANYC